MVPLECCTIPPGQILRKQIPPSKMNDVLTFSKKTPDQRFAIIRQGVQVRDLLELSLIRTFGLMLDQYLQYGQSEYISALGLRVDTRGPMEVNGRVLNPPKLIYGQNVQVVCCLPFFEVKLSCKTLNAFISV